MQNQMQLYLVRMKTSDGEEVFYKVGVTRVGVKARFDYGRTKVGESDLAWADKVRRRLNGQEYISDTPYDVERVHAVIYNYKGDALIAEREFLAFVESSKYQPKKYFSGWGECFRDDAVAADLRRLMDEDSSRRNAEAPDELRYKMCAIRIRQQDPIERHKAILDCCRQKIG